MWIGPSAAILALLVGLAGPTAYAAQTMATAQAGGDPAAGPAVAGGLGGPRGAGGPASGPDGAGRPAGGPGAGVNATADAALVDYLVASRGSARWIVAASGSQVAAAIQLAAGQPVLTMGGFTGGDPAPTLDQLRAMIASGELRYVLLGGGPGGPGGPGGGPADGPGGGPDGAAQGSDGGFLPPGGFAPPGAPNGGDSARTTWITSSCTAVTVAGATSALYDCAGAT
jgi:hypothetical protein